METKADKAFLQDSNEITFNDEDMEVGYSDHMRPLYLAASINQIPIKRALVDKGALVNFIPLNTLQAVVICADSGEDEEERSALPAVAITILQKSSQFKNLFN